MIRISQLKLKPDHSPADLERLIRRKLRLKEEDSLSWKILRKSVDARKKPDLFFSPEAEKSRYFYPGGRTLQLPAGSNAGAF